MYFKIELLLVLLHVTLGFNLLLSPQMGWTLKSKTTRKEDETHVKLSNKDISFSYTFSKATVERLKRFEYNLDRSKSESEVDDEFKELMSIAKNALVVEKTTLQLFNTHCHNNQMSAQKCVEEMAKYKVDPFRKEICEPLTRINCTGSSAIRRINGECNNLLNPGLGKSLTSYQRLLYPAYQDGIYRPRGNGKHSLPSARLVSKTLADSKDVRGRNLTLAFMQWGQFVEHDLAKTVSNRMIHTGNIIHCCSRDGTKLAPRYVHPFCQPIVVPEDDHFLGKQNIKCLNYVRSMGGLRIDCTLGPLEQLNEATHFLDGSQLYGNTLATSLRLRTGNGGKLKTSEGQYPSLKKSENCHSETCFDAGDSRINDLPQSAVMYTLWIREHNRIAEILMKMNPMKTDQELFEEARKIVIAQMQHITYKEWLPLVLGNKEMKRIMQTSKDFAQIDPSVSNSFANAAMKSFLSLMPESFELYDEDRHLMESSLLKQNLNNPSIVKPKTFDGVMRGLSTQPAQKIDLNFARELIDLAYDNGTVGPDQLSLGIQRGRDHGLPSYNQFRKLCGLMPAKSFDQFSDYIPPKIIKLLKDVYKRTEDVDLLIGGLSESPRNSESILGPTFTCIMMDQFDRTRKGDRYFYDLNSDLFNADQLVQLTKVTLSTIFCNNGNNIKQMQQNIFLSISERNPLRNCSDFPEIDWSIFKF